MLLILMETSVKWALVVPINWLTYNVRLEGIAQGEQTQAHRMRSVSACRARVDGHRRQEKR